MSNFLLIRSLYAAKNLYIAYLLLLVLLLLFLELKGPGVVQVPASLLVHSAFLYVYRESFLCRTLCLICQPLAQSIAKEFYGSFALLYGKLCYDNYVECEGQEREAKDAPTKSRAFV